MTSPIRHVHSFRFLDGFWTAFVAKVAKRGLTLTSAVEEAIEDWMKK